MGDAFPDRAAIVTSQLAQLRALIGALVPANAFHSRKLNAAGVTDRLASLEEFSRAVPFTTKFEIVADQLATPPHGSNLTFPLSRYTRFHQTSGTTGTPIRWLDTPESWEGMVESWVEVLRAAEVTAADRVFFAFSFGPFLGFWLAFEAAQRLGCLCLPGGGLGSAARLRLMLDNRATILCCTPTYAAHLAEVAGQEKIDLRQAAVKTVMVAGEAGGSIPAVRARLEQLWNGARIFDHHGMTETGPVTHQCPTRPGVLHVMESAYFPEIVDPASGTAVKTGGTGELVLTTLRRTASPLLRYRTGDLAKACHSPCSCGRNTLALDGGILGRVDDMVIVRGVNVHPAAVEEIIRTCGDVVEYQAIVSRKGSLAELSLRIEPARICSDADALARRLEKAFYEVLALRVPVLPVPPGTLPRFEMKAKRWIRD